MAGVKPAAKIDYDQYHEKFKQHVDSGKLISKPIINTNIEKPDYLVGLKGQEKRIDKLHTEFNKSTIDHKKIGMLLGYTKEHIRKFVDE